VRHIIIAFHTSVDTDKTILKGIIYEGVLDWIQLAVDGIVCRVSCIRGDNILIIF